MGTAALVTVRLAPVHRQRAVAMPTILPEIALTHAIGLSEAL
ncbi:hypothetical protein KPB2_5529 [Klebsiella pneumoniae Kb677]|nr:hypothetical protein KPB2_5529 [Klebsiella pneumoniae Kb677]